MRSIHKTGDLYNKFRFSDSFNNFTKTEKEEIYQDLFFLYLF